MKRFIILLFCLFLSSVPALAKDKSSKFREGELQYKSGNYIGCMQTMLEVTSVDPENAFAHYYLAISYAQIGKKEEAIEEYNKVISLNPNSQLMYYTQLGLKNLGSDLPLPPEPSSQSAKIPMPDNKTISDDAKNVLMEKDLLHIINNLNQNGQIDPSKLKNLENFLPPKSDNSTTPSQEELVKAMQLNMLMSSMNGMNSNSNGMNSNMNYNPMSILPFLMMYQNSNENQNSNPQLMENMLNSMMLPNMF
ncbi:MAG: tetratricopeptide repeat protein [bacterium]